MLPQLIEPTALSGGGLGLGFAVCFALGFACGLTGFSDSWPPQFFSREYLYVFNETSLRHLGHCILSFCVCLFGFVSSFTSSFSCSFTSSFGCSIGSSSTSLTN